MEYTGRSVVRASVKNLSPSGSSTNCGNMTPGVRKAVWRFQTGQDPPYSAMLKLVALNLLVTFPALSTRKKKNGTPRFVSLCKVVKRWQTCSNETAKAEPIRSMS